MQPLRDDLTFNPDDDRAPMTGKEAYVEVDPVLADFAHSPYDPIYGARAMGRVTGQVIAGPPRAGWLRTFGFVLAVALIGRGVFGLYWAGEIVAGTGGGAERLAMELLRIAVETAPFGVGGLLLLWRLLRPARSADRSPAGIRPPVP